MCLSCWGSALPPGVRLLQHLRECAFWEAKNGAQHGASTSAWEWHCRRRARAMQGVRLLAGQTCSCLLRCSLHALQGWCGTGPRFCAVGKCLSGACEGDALPEPPGCAETCSTSAVEGRRARALCRSGLVITAVAAPVYGVPTLGCNSTLSYR